MSLNANDYKQESKFTKPDPLEVGTYPARLVQVIGVGLQKQNPYQGEPKDPRNELYLTYELVDEFLLDEEGNEDKEKPRFLSENFPMHSLDSDLAKSTKRYYALDPEEDYKGMWSELVGTPCMVTVVQNKGKGKYADTIYNNVSSVQTMRSKEAAKCPELVNPTKVFDADTDDVETFLSLSTYIQKVIKEGLEFEGSILDKALQAHEDGSEGGSTKKEAKPSQQAAQESSDPKEVEEEEDW